jgi:predicted  nucleic acid-binding Zn-ribbon protein
MESESTESGLEELQRLSKEITKVDRERTKAEQDRAEQRQQVRELQQGLIELKASVALEQLKPIATPEIIEEISSLKHKQTTGDLRKVILDLSAELEKWVDNTSDSKQDMDSIKRSVKTLAILIELLFSIE